VYGLRKGTSKSGSDREVGKEMTYKITWKIKEDVLCMICGNLTLGVDFDLPRGNLEVCRDCLENINKRVQEEIIPERMSTEEPRNPYTES